VSAGYSHTLLLCDGNVYTFGDNTYGQLGLNDFTQRYAATLIPTLNNITQIYAGSLASLVVTDDQRVYAFGFNNVFSKSSHSLEWSTWSKRHSTKADPNGSSSFV
jgi:alpha-tubulin suppressor-like RCC1 family protein